MNNSIFIFPQLIENSRSLSESVGCHVRIYWHVASDSHTKIIDKIELLENNTAKKL